MHQTECPYGFVNPPVLALKGLKEGLLVRRQQFVGVHGARVQSLSPNSGRLEHVDGAQLWRTHKLHKRCTPQPSAWQD